MKFVYLLILLFSYAGIKAQQNHFIYIQTENRQPFYVKLQDKLYSSSASGYLIVPKLKQGDYSLAVGFPKTEWAEQQFVSSVGDNDAGYLLKNFGEKGWGLFNLQTLNVTMSGVRESSNEAVVEMKTNDDAFSNMLSSVVNDSTIRQTEVVKAKPVIEPVVVEPVQQLDTPAVIVQTTTPPPTQENPPVTETSTAPVVVTPPAYTPVTVGDTKKEMTLEEAKEILRQSEIRAKGGNPMPQPADKTAEVVPVSAISTGIVKASVKSNEQGTEMLYVDKAQGFNDTITVFIPAETVAGVGEEQHKAAEATDVPLPGSVPVDNSAAEKPAETRFLDITVPPAGQEKPENTTTKESKLASTPPVAETASRQENAVDAVENVTKDPQAVSTMINSDCKSVATDDDFLKLRKRMVAGEDEDEMVIIAKKLFKSKCFKVEQIKNLSVLFLKDAGKYAFFDAAYPFAADSHNFNTLQAQLSDSYYISRFQAMIRR